jgi:16S rRNA processing protein RimM
LDDARICVAKIGAAHGVRGEVRLWHVTEDPLAVTRYGALETEDGARRFEIASARAAKDHLVARIKGVDTRDDAEKLTGLELYVARARLPKTDADEFYHADLIGLAASTPDGREMGRVVAVHNFGAGDILEIAPKQGVTFLLPFTNAAVPHVDIVAGTLTIDPPTEIEGDDPAQADI